MKYISLSLLLLGAYNTIHTMKRNSIKLTPPMPNDLKKRPKYQVSSTVIHDRLEKMRLHDFVQKTKIDEKLGNQLLYPGEFIMRLECEITSYNKQIKETCNDPLCTRTFGQNMIGIDMKSPIIRAILAGHPMAIKQLAKENYLLDILNKQDQNRRLRKFAEENK